MVRTLVKTAWGMTLGLSHEDSQRAFNAVFVERYNKMMEKLLAAEEHSVFASEINAALSRFMRNLGFEKDIVVQELDIWKSVRERRITTFNEIVDMTSFSKEGFFARIASFLLGGSISVAAFEFDGLLANLTSSEDKVVNEAAEQVAAAIDLVGSEGIGFILGGMVFMIGVLVLLRLSRDYYVEKVMANTLLEQHRHWKGHVRPSFEKHLVQLCDDLIVARKNCYEKYDRDDLQKGDIKSFVSELLPAEDIYAKAWGEKGHVNIEEKWPWLPQWARKFLVRKKDERVV